MTRLGLRSCGWAVTALEGGTVEMWEVLLGSGSPQDTALLADLAEAVGGFQVNEFGSLVVLESQVRVKLIDKLLGACNVPSQENFIVWRLRRLSVSQSSAAK